jgi:hypothetical protein
MWTPTRPDNGEGNTDREEARAGTRNSPTNEHLIRSTRGIEHGMQRRCSELLREARDWLGGAAPNVARKGDGQSGSRRGPYDCRCRVMPAEERALTSGVLVKEGRSGD